MIKTAYLEVQKFREQTEFQLSHKWQTEQEEGTEPY